MEKKKMKMKIIRTNVEQAFNMCHHLRLKHVSRGLNQRLIFYVKFIMRRMHFTSTTKFSSSITIKHSESRQHKTNCFREYHVEIAFEISKKKKLIIYTIINYSNIMHYYVYLSTSDCCFYGRSNKNNIIFPSYKVFWFFFSLTIYDSASQL